jgi:autotransporter passenger strand-loop-strand repeat protein
MANYFISSGITSTGLTLNRYDWMYVSSGGVAIDIVENGGNATVAEGANVTFVPNAFSGAVLSECYATVHSGTTANSTAVCGTCHIDDQAEMHYSYGGLNVFSGGIANDTIVDSYGSLNVFGGVVNGVIVNSSGSLNVNSGGGANNIIVNRWGCFHVGSGGTVNSTTINGPNYMNSDFACWGTINDTIINEGQLFVCSGGIANSTTVNSYWGVRVESGGTVNNTLINSTGEVFISSGGRASNTTISGGFCASSIYPDNGILTIAFGGIAKYVTVCTYGHLRISSGGTATKIVENGGYVDVENGAKATFVANTISGLVLMGGNGSAFDTGLATIHSGTTAHGATLNSAGGLYVFSSGTATSTTVFGNGSLTVLSGGVACDTKVYAGGMVKLTSGAKATGKMNLAAGAVIFVENGAVLDFDLTKISAGEKALLTDWSLLQGKPDYTLTVNDNQANGVYALANEAEDFKGTITIQNTFGKSLGTLTVGQTVAINDSNYTLNLVDETLTLTIGKDTSDTVAPTVSNVKADIIAPTNQNVTVTAEFDDDVGVVSKLYRIGEAGEWTAYLNGVTISTNTTVFFKAVDAAGNNSEIVSYTVSNIDKDAPMKPTASASVTEQTTGEVLVSAVFSNDSEVKEYSLDGQNWKTYTEAIKFTENGFVFFRGTDVAGNNSEITVFQVTNIRKDNPVPPVEEGVFGPDTREDGWLYDKKTKKLNESVTESTPIEITSETEEILFDEAGSISHEEKDKTWQNFVGKGKVADEAIVDDTDFVKICLDNPARLSFSVEATDAMKFTVYSLVAGTDKNGNATHTMKSIQTTALKKDKSTGLYSTTTKAILLERMEVDRDYYISMQSTNKKAESVFYNVSLVTEGDKASIFYADADGGENNWLYDKKSKKRNEAVAESDSVYVNSATKDVPIDAGGTSLDEWDNFVGFGDDADHAKITLDHAASLRFTINATDAAKFVIYSLTPGKNDTYTMKTLQTSALKKVDNAKYEVTTKALLLAAGDYYVSVQATNAKKGGEAYYNVSLNSASIFFSDGDNGDNNWLYDKKAKIKNDDANFEEIILEDGTSDIHLDTNAPSGTDGNGWSNYVGYGDDTDFAKLTVSDTAKVSFSLKASDAAKFTIYSLTPGLDKKQNVVYTMKAIQMTSLKKAGTQYEADTKTILLTDGVYYISMQSTNAKKGVKAFYIVTATYESITPVKKALSSQDMDAWVGPDTVDSVCLDAWNASAIDYESTQDDLFTRLDVVQDASLASADIALDSTSERIFEESGKGVLASL